MQTSGRKKNGGKGNFRCVALRLLRFLFVYMSDTNTFINHISPCDLLLQQRSFLAVNYSDKGLRFPCWVLYLLDLAAI